MKNLILAGAAAAAVIAIVPAVAQPAPPPPPGVAPGVAPVTEVRTQVIRMPRMAETRDAVVAHVRDMFARLDTNKDGYITKPEADAGHQAMAGDWRGKFGKHFEGADFPHPDRGAMFDKLDANKDGAISRQEFMAAQPQINQRHVIVMRDGEGGQRVEVDGKPVEGDGGPGAPHVKMMRMHGMGGMHGKMFEMADANHDGRVSMVEMTNAALRHFDEADANHDGKLTPDERMQMHREMIEKHAKARPA